MLHFCAGTINVNSSLHTRARTLLCRFVFYSVEWWSGNLFALLNLNSLYFVTCNLFRVFFTVAIVSLWNFTELVLLACIAHTTYVDAVYCYWPSSVVGLSVGSSVSWPVTLVSPAKTAEPIDMPFVLRTQVGPRNNVLDGGPDPPWEGAIFSGKGHPL